MEIYFGNHLIMYFCKYNIYIYKHKYAHIFTVVTIVFLQIYVQYWAMTKWLRLGLFSWRHGVLVLYNLLVVDEDVDVDEGEG